MQHVNLTPGAAIASCSSGTMACMPVPAHLTFSPQGNWGACHFISPSEPRTSKRFRTIWSHSSELHLGNTIFVPVAAHNWYLSGILRSCCEGREEGECLLGSKGLANKDLALGFLNASWWQLHTICCQMRLCSPFLARSDTCPPNAQWFSNSSLVRPLLQNKISRLCYMLLLIPC